MTQNIHINFNKKKSKTELLDKFILNICLTFNRGK